MTQFEINIDGSENEVFNAVYQTQRRYVYWSTCIVYDMNATVQSRRVVNPAVDERSVVTMSPEHAISSLRKVSAIPTRSSKRQTSEHEAGPSRFRAVVKRDYLQ